MTLRTSGISADQDLEQRRADSKAMPRKASLMGVQVSISDMRGIEDYLEKIVLDRRGGFVSCANAYSLGLASEDLEFLNLLNSADVVTTDGMPVVWALRLLGYNCERVHNDDLVLACCGRFPEWRHFLVGGRVGQPEEVAAVLRARFPNINIVGTHPTPERPVPKKVSDEIIRKIEDSGASVVWAALGTPQQDYWMRSVTESLQVPLVGCGSLFDLLSGRTRPTPTWMKRSGLQWLFRLAQEPRRLAYRYARFNTKFILGVLNQYRRQRWQS